MNKLSKAMLTVMLAIVAGVSQAETPPSGNITIIVPTTPGTGSDIAARLLAPHLAKRLGQSVIVENKTGASGTIGIGAAAKAAPDGNTILFVPNTMAMISLLYKNLPWSPVDDFAPVARLGKMLVAVVVNPSLPVNSVDQLVALAKSQPGKLNYGTPGTGTPHHLRTEQFKQITDANIMHVPYRGSAGAVTDLVGGQVQMGFFPLHSVLQMVAVGKLKMLATSGESRSAWTPSVPTFRESGIKGLNDYDWLGAFLPKGTPKATVDRLSHELLAVLDLPDVKKELADRGIIANPGGPGDLESLLRNELLEWKKVVDHAHIVAD